MMAEIHEEPIYGLKVRESADDGSDFGVPEADYRIWFVGEDGYFHLKDAAGTVTTPAPPSPSTPLTAKGTYAGLGTPVSNNSNIGANNSVFGRLVLPFAFTPNRIGTAIHISSGNIDLGVYADDGTGLAPGAKIASLGSTPSPGTGVREFAIAPGQLGPGVYWLAIAADNATVSFPYVGPGTGSGNGGGGVLQQVKAGVYPLPASAVSLAQSTFIPTIWLSIL